MKHVNLGRTSGRQLQKIRELIGISGVI